MKVIRSTTLATMALTLLSALPLAGPVSAQSVSHTASTVSTKTWSVQGALTIGKVGVIFPVGSTFTASYNSNNGALTNGSLSVPERTISWPGIQIDISVKLKDLGDATGTLAPNGVATINESLTATINNSYLPVPCDVGPMDITVSTASAGGSVFQGAPSTGTLVDSEITAPRPTVAGACTEQFAEFYSSLPLPANGNVTVTLTEVVNPVSSRSTKTWAVQGNLAIGQITVPFPAGSRFTASYDANSGTLSNGSLSVPETTLYSEFTVKLKDLGDATGTLAPNGVATISESLTASLKVSGMNGSCDIGPMVFTVGTLAPGGSAFHGTPSSGTLVDPLFTAPVPLVTSQCPQEAADFYRTLPLPSDGSVTVTLTELPSTSSAPVNATAQGAPGHAIVSWQPPRNTYGAPVSEYRVTVVRANTTTVVTMLYVSGTTTQKVVTLPVGSYSVSVAAVTSNGVGASATTSRISVTSTKGLQVPPAPTSVWTATVGNGQVTLAWLAPALGDGGSRIYQYVVSDGKGHGCVVGTDARIAVRTFSCTVTGLTNGRLYGFTVQAVNIMGASVASAVKVASAASAPTSAPTLSISSITGSRVTMNVTAPANMGGRPLMNYQVSFNNGRTWSSLANCTSGDQLYVGSLKPNTTYRVLISARNAIGAGPAVSVTFKTARK